MKRIRTIICLIALLIGSKSFANCGPNCGCESECNSLSFEFYADYLYWRVVKIDENTFNTIVGINQFTFNVQPSYSSGYRVGAGFYCNCFDLGARYTSFHNSASTTAPFELATSQVFSQTYRLNYEVVDIALGYTHFFQCCPLYLKPYIGTKLAWLGDKTRSERVNTTPIDFSAHTRAFGPMVGVEGGWEMFRCYFPISLFARGDLSLLSATANVTRGTSFLFSNELHSVITVADLYIGLGIDLCNFSCFNADFQIGYETQSWIGYTPDVLASPTRSITIGLNGLVARLGVMF